MSLRTLTGTSVPRSRIVLDWIYYAAAIFFFLYLFGYFWTSEGGPTLLAMTLVPVTFVLFVLNALREVHLLQGEAYFEVAHDASRPFVVYAGGNAVRAAQEHHLLCPGQANVGHKLATPAQMPVVFPAQQRRADAVA